MDKALLYLDFEPSIQKILSENGISVGSILSQNNIDGEIQYGVLPSSNQDGSRSKEVVTIIVASSVLILSIGTAISQVINALSERPHLIEYEDILVVEDSNGNVIRDKNGDPIVKMVKRTKLLEPISSDRSTEIEAKLTDQMVLKFRTSDNEFPTKDNEA